MFNKKLPPTPAEMEKLLAEVEVLAWRASEYDIPLAGLLFTILACFSDPEEKYLQALVNFSFELVKDRLEDRLKEEE